MGRPGVGDGSHGDAGDNDRSVPLHHRVNGSRRLLVVRLLRTLAVGSGALGGRAGHARQPRSAPTTAASLADIANLAWAVQSRSGGPGPQRSHPRPYPGTAVFATP